MANSFPVTDDKGNQDVVLETFAKIVTTNQDSTGHESVRGLRSCTLRSNGHHLNVINADSFEDVHTKIVYRRIKI